MTKMASLWAMLATMSALASGESGEAELKARLPEIFAKSAAHYKALDAVATPLMRNGKEEVVVPHGFDCSRGTLDMQSARTWTAGHYVGALWYLYEATGEDFFKDRAMVWMEVLAPNSKVTETHDIGFIMYCSYGNARRLLKTKTYDALLRETAESLCVRFSEKLGLIRSWGKNGETKDFLVIPDNLMNLELLEAVSAICGEKRFAKIAESHADMTMRHHYRADGSCYHVLDYDQNTCEVKTIFRGQGASVESTWSRGQGWSIYGYTMMYRMTHAQRYLDLAVKLADYVVNNPDLPADGVPYWDYSAIGEERDSSAGAITASGLLELSRFAEGPKAARYRALAVRQLLSLASSEYFSEGEEIGHFLLKHGVGVKPANSEIDTPLVYGDYYFLEALLRFRGLAECGGIGFKKMGQ